MWCGHIDQYTCPNGRLTENVFPLTLTLKLSPNPNSNLNPCPNPNPNF